LITIKIDRDKTRADFASVLAGPRLAIERASNERPRDHSWAHIEQVARQGVLPLNDCQPPPALTPPSAGTSGDRPDLPADDWTAPSTAKPVAAAAIGSVVGSLASVGTNLWRVAPQRKQQADVRLPAKQVQP